MAQSLAQVYIHLIFHTKYSSVTICEEDLPKLFAYIDGIIVNKNAMVIQIGGVPNHLHILCTLPRILSMADFVEDIKKCSSKWIKTLFKKNVANIRIQINFVFLPRFSQSLVFGKTDKQQTKTV